MLDDSAHTVILNAWPNVAAPVGGVSREVRPMARGDGPSVLLGACWGNDW